MPYDPFLSDEPFSLGGISAVSRGGSLPPGWLDAYGTYLRRSHARAAAEIAATLAEARGAAAPSTCPAKAP